MGKALAGFLLTVLIVGIGVSFFYVPELRKINPFANLYNPEAPQPAKVEKLKVDLSESGKWIGESRSSIYSSIVTYTILNHGNTTKNNIEIEILVDGEAFKNFTVKSLAPNNFFVDRFPVSVKRDSTKRVSLTASCSASTDTETLVIYAIQTRKFNKELAKLYVTPDDPTVQETVDTIVKDPLIPDWMEIRDWVAKKIKYTNDAETHQTSEYWQLPKETLTMRTGDCEDLSILLCSLLRADGWTPDDVYVVIGEKNGELHAWVKLNVDAIGWQNIEPQEGMLNTIVGDSYSLSGYTAKYNFNDVYFKTI